jgi:DNA-binding transcriptional LysR family regulator
MRRRLPPLEQIEAFVQAARAPSFRIAAERCALSPAAFSRRIQQFSAFVGLKLFERQNGSQKLTEDGRRCLEELEPAYLELRRVAAGVISRDDTAGVRLSLSHSLAVGWLIPRLDSFRAAHPDIDLSYKTQRDASDLRAGGVDLALCFTDIDLTGFDFKPLLPVTLSPVAAPSLAEAFKADGSRLERQRLLSVVSHMPHDAWSWWKSETGFEGALEPAVTFDIMHAMYETASRGLGVAIGASPTIGPHLETGRLVRIGLPTADYPGGYRLAVSPSRKRRREVMRVWHWLEAEARATPSLAQH